MSKILFRADANPSIGTGDLVSLIHLSQYFEKKGWETHFIIREYKSGLLLAEKYRLGNVKVLPHSIAASQEVEAINQYIELNNIKVIVMEITERPLSEYEGITDQAVRACVCFDALIPRHLDLVVNWDVTAPTLYEKSPFSKTKFLLGSEYVILPMEFDYGRIEQRVYRETRDKLLIAMGGADELNFTQKVVDVLIQNAIAMELKIIIGSGYEYRYELEKSLDASPLRYEIKQNVTHMFDEYMQCDIAIGAGGLTSYELVATRTPAILIATYEHQIARCIYFEKAGWALYHGFRKVSPSALLEGLQQPILRERGPYFNGCEKIYEAVASCR
ncbi:MAG: glycosyltransferase [Nitrospirota bacterium]